MEKITHKGEEGYFISEKEKEKITSVLTRVKLVGDRE